MNKRILLSGRLHGRGGMETHLLHLSELLVKAGCQVTIVSRYASPTAPLVAERHERGIRFVTTPFARNLRWFKLSTMWAVSVWPMILRGRSFDVLYTLEDSKLTVFLRRFVRDNGRVIYNRAGEPLSESEGVRENLRKVVDGVIVESEVQAEAWRENSGTNVPVIIAPFLGHEPESVSHTRNNQDTVRVAYLGRYERGKGVYRLLEIWDACRDKLLRLDFFGHGSERAALVAEIERRGLSHLVEVHDGWNTAREMDAILAGCDLVVLPSESEGLPGILVESMARGVPFVATDVGAVRTLAEGNPDVRVVPLDTDAVKAAVLEMASAIRSGAIQRERLRQYHTAHFGRKVLADKWLTALLDPERVWGKRAPSR
jgi:glycosyltransferase involved in cell wall biosynthesis